MSDIATPPGGGGNIALLLKLRWLPWTLARIGIWAARRWGKPFRFGKTMIAVRHRDVRDVLDHDLDFVVAPVNAPRFDGIDYRFILGMDRGDELVRERQVLYEALSRVPMAAIEAAAASDIAARLAVASDRIDAIEGLARPVAAATARRVFGIIPDDDAVFMDVARAIFAHCFLNAANDSVIEARALKAGRLLTGWIDAEIAARRASGSFGTDMMGQMLTSKVDPDLIRRTLGGMLVGSIDTTATCVAKIVTVAMGDNALRRRMHADRDDATKSWGWCNEALRRWNHVPLLGRRAASGRKVAGVSVPSGGSVILWTQAAMLDPEAFPHPSQMRPDRPNAAYLHAGAGLHPCAGRAINAWQIPMLVNAILVREPVAAGKMQWAGPFPAAMPLQLREVRP